MSWNLVETGDGVVCGDAEWGSDTHVIKKPGHEGTIKKKCEKVRCQIFEKEMKIDKKKEGKKRQLTRSQLWERGE